MRESLGDRWQKVRLMIRGTMPPAGTWWLKGKRFLVAALVSESTPAPFIVVLNWQAGLKK